MNQIKGNPYPPLWAIPKISRNVHFFFCDQHYFFCLVGTNKMLLASHVESKYINDRLGSKQVFVEERSIDLTPLKTPLFIVRG